MSHRNPKRKRGRGRDLASWPRLRFGLVCAGCASPRAVNCRVSPKCLSSWQNGSRPASLEILAPQNSTTTGTESKNAYDNCTAGCIITAGASWSEQVAVGQQLRHSSSHKNSRILEQFGLKQGRANSARARRLSILPVAEFRLRVSVGLETYTLWCRMQRERWRFLANRDTSVEICCNARRNTLSGWPLH